MLMRNLKRLAVVVVAFAAMLAVPALGAEDVTVGDFVIGLAKLKQLNAADSRIAADSLEAVGVRLPGDVALNQRLTEGEVARISRLAGLNVTTSRPDRQFTRLQMDLFFDSFGSELAGDSGTATMRTDNYPPSVGFDPISKGKGKKKGLWKRRTPTEPE
jgi:hypothetical protein